MMVFFHVKYYNYPRILKEIFKFKIEMEGEKIKKLIIYCLIMVLVLGAAGCSQNTAEKGSQSDNVVINIGVMPDVESIPFLIAQKNGYYEQEGVKVNIEHFSSAKDRDSALQSGKLDGVITDMAAVLFANEGGIKLRMISRNDGDITLTGGEDSGINSVAELKGKDIGLSTNTIMEYTTDRMLEAAGLKPSDVNKIAIPPLPTRLEMLQGGKVTAAILPEPMSGLAIENGALILSSTAELKNKAGAIAFMESTIFEYPEKISAVFRAYDKAVEYLHTETAENYIDFIIEEQSFPAAIKDSLVLPEYHKAESPSEAIFNDVVLWMQEKELIKGKYEYKELTSENILN